MYTMCITQVLLYNLTGEEQYGRAVEVLVYMMCITQVLLYNLTGEEQYRRAVEGTMQDWFPGGSLRYSPKGLAYRLQWGSLRYACQLVTCGHPFTPVSWLHVVTLHPCQLVT